MSAAFPLSAVVGQGALVEALLVNAVSPDVGGVLVRGERGTAKSTAVRGLAPLLPPVSAAADEAFAYAPGERAPGGRVAEDAPIADRPASLVELPLGTTLDRLVGSLDLRRALAGEHTFEPGILARAHRGILYVDEVNLLPAHLVDALLDAAASGIARVEREAVSAEHAARFILVGTMNVEEGELRPQLLDRFGLGVEVGSPTDPDVRAEIVRRRLAFEADPESFAERWSPEEARLAARIADARARLDSVRLPERELLRITRACARLGVDGVRGDIVSARAARALAALDGVDEVSEDQVRRAAALALAHRRRRDPLDGRPTDDEDLQRAFDGSEGEEPPDGPPTTPPGGGGTGAPASSSAPAQSSRSADAPSPAAETGRAGSSPEARASDDAEQSAPGERPSPSRDPAPSPGQAAAPARLGRGTLTLAGVGRGPAGGRARTSGPGAGSIDSRPASGEPDDVALLASLRARLLGDDRTLREHVREGREGAFLCLVVDASGSMAARRRLARVKGALAELLRDAYARRDRVAVVAFRDDAAEILVEPGAPIERAAAAIAALPAGGRTPLAAGLALAVDLVRREALREPERRSIAVVLTDGRVRDPEGAVPRAAAALGRAASAVDVVDTEEGAVRVGLAANVARVAGGSLHHLVAPTAISRRAA